jgi:peptide/nickel transport system substrate-binding protein
MQHSNERRGLSGRRLPRRRLLASGTVAGGSALLLAACGGGKDSPSTGASAPSGGNVIVAATGTPKPGGTINIAATDDAPNLDGHRSAAGQTATTIGPVYSRLLTFKTGPGVDPWANELIGDLAEHWEQPNPQTYVFQIRKNAKWQNLAPVNGRALTAEDIVYSLNRIRTPEPEYTYGYLFDVIDKLEVPDASTVRITTKEPFAPFADNLANQNALIVPREAVEQFGDLKQKAIGSGPFMMEEATKGTRYVYAKNPNYYLPGQPYLDKMNMLVLPDEAYRVSALRSKQLDNLSVTKAQVDELTRADKSLVLQKNAGSAGTRMAVNNTRPPYNDPRVREAVDRAIDRKALIATVLEGDGTITGPISSNLAWWSVPDAEIEDAYRPDLQKAKQLLTEAGFPNGFKTTWEISGVRTPLYVKVMEVMKEQLKRVGIDLTIDNIEYAVWQKHANTFDFVAFFTGLRSFSDPDNYLYRLYHPKSPQRYCEPDNAELVSLIEKQRITVDKEERKALVHQAQRLILKEHYVSGIYSTPTYYLSQPHLKGWSPSGSAASTNIEFVHAWVDKS